MTITYKVRKGLYVNMTNRCNCSCTFCLRKNGPTAYGSAPLWLEREPDVTEVCKDIEKHNFDDFEEIVFCGYGEPTERLSDILEVCRFIKSKSSIPVRLNTNGLSDLLYGENTAHRLKGLIDAVSISLNAVNKEDYLKVTNASYGLKSFDSMLSFAKDCTKYVPSVTMTVVDKVTSEDDQKKAAEICKNLGVKLRIRPLES